MSNNPHRGEVTFILAGKEYEVRPTFQYIASVENAMGMGILQLLRRIAAMEFTVNELVSLVHLAVRSAGCKLKRDEIGELVVGNPDGFVSYLEPISQLLTMALTGPTRKEKKEGDEEGEA